MAAPTDNELRIALEEAARMREHKEDPHFIAKSLLNTHYRLGLLERVMSAAKHFLHSGLAPHEHAQLVRAIEFAERAAETLGHEHDTFGLESDA